MSESDRAAEVVALFEDTVARLRAERGDGDPLAIAVDAFAAVHARFPDLSEAETERAAGIRAFNACCAVFEAARGRLPTSRDELDQWLATPQGRAAYQRAGRNLLGLPWPE